MQPLQTWAVSVCAAAIVCAILYRLFPDTSVGKQGRLLLPTLFLFVLISPLFSAGGMTWTPVDIDVTTDVAALQAQVRRQTVQHVNDTLLRMVNQALAGHGYRAEKVVTDMDIAENGSISMGQIVVYVDERTVQRSALVEQIAAERLGMAVTVREMEVRAD